MSDLVAHNDALITLSIQVQKWFLFCIISQQRLKRSKIFAKLSFINNMLEGGGIAFIFLPNYILEQGSSRHFVILMWAYDLHR